MTVYELIRKLEDLPPDLPVVRYADHGDRTEVALVHQRIDADTHEPYIWLE